METGRQLILLLTLAVNVTCGEQQNGHWGEWSQVSACSVTCGSGVQRRTRVWVPAANDGGGEPRVYTASYGCSDPKHLECPTDGVWTSWFPIGSCSKMCGGGTRRHQRVCEGTNWGGKDCEGDKEKDIECGKEPCPRLPRNFDLTQCVEGKNFTCTSGEMCVPAHERCDGKLQCHDGTDEKNCPRVGSSRGGGSKLEIGHFLVTAFTFFVIVLLH